MSRVETLLIILIPHDNITQNVVSVLRLLISFTHFLCPMVSSAFQRSGETAQTFHKMSKFRTSLVFQSIYHVLTYISWRLHSPTNLVNCKIACDSTAGRHDFPFQTYLLASSKATKYNITKPSSKWVSGKSCNIVPAKRKMIIVLIKFVN